MKDLIHYTSQLAADEFFAYALELLQKVRGIYSGNLANKVVSESLFTMPFSTRDWYGRRVEAVLIDPHTHFLPNDPHAMNKHAGLMSAVFNSLDADERWHEC